MWTADRVGSTRTPEPVATTGWRRGRLVSVATMCHLRVGRVRVGLVLVAALLAGACGGGGAGSSDDGAEPGAEPVGADGGAEPGGESQAAPAAVSEVSEDAGVEPQGFGGQPLGDFDLERLLEAARTLDPDADCPVAVGPESLDGVVEVLRIEGGCAIVDYVALGVAGSARCGLRFWRLIRRRTRWVCLPGIYSPMCGRRRRRLMTVTATARVIGGIWIGWARGCFGILLAGSTPTTQATSGVWPGGLRM